MKRNIREIVYSKFNGRCAYCGTHLTFEEMKIDHFVPKKSGGSEDIENLMPSCETCNHYKGHSNIFKFKKMMQTIHKKISKLYIIKVAQKFGLITIKEFENFFYEKKD